MPQHPAPGTPAGENPLHEIAQKEQELQQKIAEARAEASRIVERAQREADGIRAAAQDQARQAAAAAATATEQEGQKISGEILARAEAEVQKIRRQAEEHLPLAVDLVAGEVLGTRATSGEPA